MKHVDYFVNTGADGINYIVEKSILKLVPIVLKSTIKESAKKE